LQYRQDLRNLERLVTWEGIIGRRKRKAFDRFLGHTDPRIRQRAAGLAAEDAEARALVRQSHKDGYLGADDTSDDLDNPEPNMF